MKTIEVSGAVWDAIAQQGHFGETEDDVLRRVFKLDPAPPGARSTRSISGPRRRNRSTNRLHTDVRGGRLVVEFQSGANKYWDLPEKTDKTAIRRARDEACIFAEANDATLGQVNAVKKALTDAGYHLAK